jgi:hypothetical protein
LTSFADAFSRLGLSADADARAVRQAYARQLKRIDQATEIEAFQQLREAYDLALDDARRSAVTLDGGGSSTAPPAPAEPPPTADLDRVDGASLADATFEDFARRSAAGVASADEAAVLLQQARERLVSLEAGARFEQRVVALLARGWQPGHEFLFDAAVDAFHWTQDRRHLLAHAQAGALLQEALIERQLFLDQPDGVRHRQLALVRRLRDATPPSPTLLRDEKLMVRILVRRFPHWLGLVTSMPHVEQWLGGPEAVQAALAMPDPTQAAESASREFSVPQAILLALWVGWMIWRHYG